MTKYTDADVETLVRQVQYLLNQRDKYNSNPAFRHSDEIPWTGFRRVTEALTPFLPDPEEVLIEKMARAIYVDIPSDERDWDTHNDHEFYRQKARRALAVVKREGLPQ